jgi:hypothetical protein
VQLKPTALTCSLATDIDRSRSIASLGKESTTAATRERVRPIGDAGQKEAPWRGLGRDSQPRLRTPRKLFIAHAALAIAHCDHFSCVIGMASRKSRIVFCRNTSGGRASFYSVIKNRNRPVAPRGNDAPCCGIQHVRIRSAQTKTERRATASMRG